MTWFFHTPIAAGAAATAATINGPLGQLDAAIAAIDGVFAVQGEGGAESVATAEEAVIGIVHQTVLTLALSGDDDIDLPDGADHGAGAKVYTFPEGHILILGAVIDAVTSIDGASGGGATVNLAVGTAAASDDDELTATEANLIASTATSNGADTWQAASAASVQVDGTASAATVYVNAGVTNAVSASAVTVAITGTLTLTWLLLGTAS